VVSRRKLRELRKPRLAPAVHALLRQNREAAARAGTYGTLPSKPL
jgi:hypothetical protein